MHRPPYRSSSFSISRPQQLIDQLRVGLAAALLHHLSDQEAERLLLSGAHLLDGFPIGRHHGTYERRAAPFRPSSAPVPRTVTISSALRPESYIVANTALPVVLLMVPLSTSAMSPDERRRRQRRVVDRPVALLQRTQQFAHDPVAGGLGTGAATHDRFEVIGELRRLRQHAGVVFGNGVGASRTADAGPLAVRASSRAPRRCARRPPPAAAGRALGNSDSRAPLPCCAWSACARWTSPTAASPARTRPPPSEDVDLAIDLVLDGLLQVAERIDVLHLRLGAERGS